MMQAVRAIEGYDVVLIDTGPEIKKRPYAIDTARSGGYVILPTPPGRKGAPAWATRCGCSSSTPRPDRPLLPAVHGAGEGRDGVHRSGRAAVRADLAESAKALGILPRAPRQVSMADEEGDRYLSPLDVAPHSKFSRAVHHMVQALCDQTGLRPALPMPKSSFWQQLRGEKITIAPTASPAIG